MSSSGVGRSDTEDVSDPDVAAVRGLPLPSARIPLSRDRILSAAVAFLDEHGLAELTMRRLAEGLGVEAMSLYRYVAGREQLLDGVVEVLVTELVDDEQVVTSADHGWQDFLQRLAHGIRKMALRHPRTFPLVASRPPEAPWLRPPLRSLEWVEIFLRSLVDEGFSEDQAVLAYRAFTSFLLGHLLLEVSASGTDVVEESALDGMLPEDGHGPGLERFPLVSRVASQLAKDRSAVEFEEALESLLDRLTLLRQRST